MRYAIWRTWVSTHLPTTNAIRKHLRMEGTGQYPGVVGVYCCDDAKGVEWHIWLVVGLKEGPQQETLWNPWPPPTRTWNVQSWRYYQMSQLLWQLLLVVLASRQVQHAKPGRKTLPHWETMRLYCASSWSWRLCVPAGARSNGWSWNRATRRGWLIGRRSLLIDKQVWLSPSAFLAYSSSWL